MDGRGAPHDARLYFLAFLKKIDAIYLHIVWDNASTHWTPSVKRGLTAHCRFELHFRPTSASWLNLVERWAIVTLSR